MNDWMIEQDIKRKQLIIGKTVTTIGLYILEKGMTIEEACKRTADEMNVPEEKAKFWWSVYSA